MIFRIAKIFFQLLLDFSRNNYGVYVLGDYAYVADFDSGLQVIDVSNQMSPLLMASIDISDRSNGIYINNNYIYISSGYDGLLILSYPCFFLAQVEEVNLEGTEIKAMIPSGLARGSYTISVINIDRETDWISNGFKVSGPNPLPQIQDITPRQNGGCIITSL